jgi:hypothetical protein
VVQTPTASNPRTINIAASVRRSLAPPVTPALKVPLYYIK